MRRFLIAALLPLFVAATGSAQDIPLSKILVEGESWHLAAKDLPGVTFLEGTPDGVLIHQGGIYVRLLKPDGKVEQVALVPGSVPGTSTRVYGVSAIYQLSPGMKSITVERAQGKQVLKLDSLAVPTCLTVWPKGEQPIIGDAGGKYLWTAPIRKSGELGIPDRYYALHVKPAEQASGVTAMTMDAGNLLYACTTAGVQVFDPTGRLCGVILAPVKEAMTAICIGGEKGDTLHVACGDRLYSRKIQGKAVYTLKKEK